MCMWSSTTCASRTVLDVHVKQDYTPGKKSKIQHRTTACFPHKETHQAMVDEWKYR
jgi:hypothetical protein